MSLTNLVFKNKPLNRDYVVSESWFQAAIIGKDAKLGIMLGPNPINPKADYRKFGDMYFDRNSDPLEIHNGIEDVKHKNSIKQLRNFYSKFEKAVPDTEKQELIYKIAHKND